GAGEAGARGGGGLAAAGRGAPRKDVGGLGVRVWDPPRGRARPRPARGQRAAGAPGRRGGRGRLRRVPRHDRQRAGEAVAVRAEPGRGTLNSSRAAIRSTGSTDPRRCDIDWTDPESAIEVTSPAPPLATSPRLPFPP